MSQTITFNCPSCSAGLTVPANLAGVTGPCPTCGNSITAPHPEPEEELVPFDAPPAAAPAAQVAEDPLPLPAAPLPAPAAPLDSPVIPSVPEATLPPPAALPPASPPLESPPIAEAIAIPLTSPPPENLPPAQIPDLPLPAPAAQVEPSLPPRIEPRALPGQAPALAESSGPEPFPVISPPSSEFMPPPAPPAPAAEELPTAQPLPVATIPASRAPNELPAAHIPAQPSSTPAPQAEESPSPIPPDFNAPPVAGSVAIPPAATDLPTSLTSKPDSSAPGFPAAAASIAPVAPLEFKKRKRSKAPLMVAAALMLTAAGAAAWLLPASKEFIAAKIESFRSQSKEDQPPPIATTEQSSELSAAPATPTPTEAPSPPSDSELNTFNETPIPEAIPADVTDIPAAGAPTNRPTPPKANTNSIHDIVYEFDEENSLLKAPREALASFLGAPNWQERAKYVQSLDRVSPLMQKYYSENRDGPIFANTVTFQNSERVPGNDSMFFLFHITTDKVPEGFPVSVEETKNGMRIDWEAFVEFNDKLLFGFLNKYQEEPQRFHVIMRRAHYFGPGVPDLEEKYAFRIEPPIPGYQGYAFVDRDDAIVQNKLSYQLEWHAISYPIVELQWKRNTETLQQYVTIKDIVQNNWRAEKKTEDSVVADQ